MAMIRLAFVPFFLIFLFVFVACVDGSDICIVFTCERFRDSWWYFEFWIEDVDVSR